MTNPNRGYSRPSASNWSPMSTHDQPNGYSHQHQGVENDEDGDESEEDESDSDSDDSVATITNGVSPLTTPRDPSSDQFWSCLTCWSERLSPEDESCDFCEMTTSTIRRSRSSNKPVDIDSNGNEIVGDDVDTPWICANYGNAKLFLGGYTASDPVFESYCAECEESTDTVYADHAASYCCCDCRYERPHGTVISQGISVWKEWCRRCQRITDTVKLDIYQGGSYCCLYCREERGGEEGKRVWCGGCRRPTLTIEIDDDTDQAAVETIEEEDEEEEEDGEEEEVSSDEGD